MDTADASIIQYLENIYDAFRRLEAKSLAKQRLNLSITEWHIIDKIAPKTKRRVGDLAEAMGVTMASITVAVKKMESKGYLTRERALEDRRGVLVALTRRGKAAFQIHKQFHKHILSTMLEGLDENQATGLTIALKKLQQCLDNYG